MATCSGRSREGARGPRFPPPLIVRADWGPKGRKNLFSDRVPHPHPFISGSGWPPPPPPSPATPSIWRSGSATDKHIGSLTKQWLWDGETVFRPYPRRLESLNVCRCLCKGSTFSLRYGKTGNKRRASYFATLLQNELNSHHGCPFYHAS